MSPSLRQRLFSKSRDSPPVLPAHTAELSASTRSTCFSRDSIASHAWTATLTTPDTGHDPPSRLSPAPSDGERENDSSLNTTLTNNHRVPFYRRRAATHKPNAALPSSIDKSPPPRRRRAKQSLFSRVVQRVVPCVPDASAPQTDAEGPASDQANENQPSDGPQQPTVPIVLILPPPQDHPTPATAAGLDVIVPPPLATHLLPEEETDGVTSGAVQPPGSTGEPIARIPTRDSDDSDATSYMDDDGEDMHVFDEQAEEERLIRNGGAGIPIGPVSSHICHNTSLLTLLQDGIARPLLPPLAPQHVGRKCLVLDLDETLVHSSFRVRLRE